MKIGRVGRGEGRLRSTAVRQRCHLPWEVYWVRGGCFRGKWVMTRLKRRRHGLVAGTAVFHFSHSQLVVCGRPLSPAIATATLATSVHWFSSLFSDWRFSSRTAVPSRDLKFEMSWRGLKTESLTVNKGSSRKVFFHSDFRCWLSHCGPHWCRQQCRVRMEFGMCSALKNRRHCRGKVAVFEISHTRPWPEWWELWMRQRDWWAIRHKWKWVPCEEWRCSGFVTSSFHATRQTDLSVNRLSPSAAFTSTYQRRSETGRTPVASGCLCIQVLTKKPNQNKRNVPFGWRLSAWKLNQSEKLPGMPLTTCVYSGISS